MPVTYNPFTGQLDLTGTSGGGGGSVSSVNGQTGIVVIDAGDIGYTPGTPGDWVNPDPTTVEKGLDDLAKRKFLVVKRSVSNGEATAKQLTLVAAPLDSSNVSVSFGGVEQTPTNDFSVTGSVVSWGALGMDSIGVISGDILIIEYEKS